MVIVSGIVRLWTLDLLFLLTQLLQSLHLFHAFYSFILLESIKPEVEMKHSDTFYDFFSTTLFVYNVCNACMHKCI